VWAGGFVVDIHNIIGGGLGGVVLVGFVTLGFEVILWEVVNWLGFLGFVFLCLWGRFGLRIVHP
jgi:hypothetical protein